MGSTRTWFAKVKFKEAAKPFYFGTMVAETEMEAAKKMKEGLARILPTVPDMEFYELVPGQIIVQPE